MSSNATASSSKASTSPSSATASEVSGRNRTSSSPTAKTNSSIKVSKSRPIRQPTDLSPPAVPAAPVLASPGGLQRIGSLLSAGLKRSSVRSNQGNSLLRPDEIWSGSENQAIARTTPLSIDAQKVIDFIKRYKCYKPTGFRDQSFFEKDLPPFDSLEHYDIDEERAFKLWEWEANRLVEAVNCNKGLKFTNPMFEGPVTEEGHEQLRKLTGRIIECDSVRLYYNQLLLQVNFPRLSRPEELRTQHSLIEHLATLLNMDRTLTDEASLSALYDLIDYVTATCARLFTKSAHGPWHIWVLASLATWRAAVKVIATNPSTFCQRALDAGRSQLAKPVRSPFTTEEQASSSETGETDGSRHSNMPAFISSNRARDLYFVEAAKIKSFETPIVNHILRGLSHRAHDSLTKYDFCTVVYETGLKGFQAHIYQDKHGEILGTSLPNNLRYSASACAVMNETIESTVAEIRSRRQAPPQDRSKNLNTTNQSLVVVTIEWNYNEESGTPDTKQPASESSSSWRPTTSVEVDNMASIVSLMVAMKVTSPWIVDHLKDYLAMISHTSVDINEVKPYIVPSFDAFFRLYTRSAEEQMSSLSRWVAPLSSGLMTRQKLLSEGQHYMQSSDGDSSVLSADEGSKWGMKRLGVSRNLKKKFEVVNLSNIVEANMIMDDWTVVEKGVIVKCRWYVTGVMLIAAILVLGGLGIGFTVGQRLPGVDPFSITTYCWVLAAFVILIGRSIRVENWPWQSFLYAEVECKSVSELHAVTGVHEQLIIAKLLHEESTSILKTSGPHNFAFRRTADDGFSIDVPVTMWTMCLSGLIMTQVVTPQGNDALACLDVRRGTEYAVFVHDTNPVNSKSRLACLELIEKKQKDGKTQYRVRLTKQDLQWTKVKGLFSMPEHGAVLFV